MKLTPRTVSALIAAAIVGTSVAVVASTEVAPVSDLDYVIAEQGDNYYRIVADQGFTCTGDDLFNANGRTLLQPGTIVLVPPSCTDPVAVSTTVAPETTEATTPTEPTPTTEATTTTTEPVDATTVPEVVGATFVETFDTAASLDDWVFTVHDGRSFNDTGSTWTGDHVDTGDGCGSPATGRTLTTTQFPRVRPFSTYTNADVRAAGLAYHCPVGGDHIMTSFNTGGYAHFDFRPDRTFTDVNRVCWDQNLTDMGGKWTEVAIVPVPVFEANGQRMDYTHPDRNQDGEPGAWGLKITDGVWKGQYTDGTSGSSNDQLTDRGNRDVVETLDKVLRTQHCSIDNEDGTVTMTRGREDGTTQSDTLFGVFPAGEVVVILSDVSYNPPKRSPYSIDRLTWHWDNFIVASS